MANSPLVSIVIVCMNRPDNLYPCLDGIKKFTKVEYETFVVAFRFSAENLTKAKKDYPWVKFVESEGIRGFSENNNLALRQVSGEYCYILNDDTEMNMDVIGQLVEDMERLPDTAAIVTPKLLNIDGSLQVCGRPEFFAGNYIKQQWHLFVEPKDDTLGKTAVFDDVFQTCNISGAAFLIKTKIFKELGWFNEVYYFCPEDIELSQIARKSGYGVYVDRGAEVTHKWKQTASKISPAIRPCSIRGYMILLSEGSSLRYILIGIPIWLAEAFKYLKARIKLFKDGSEANKIACETYSHNIANIFTHKSPKEIFTKYFNV